MEIFIPLWLIWTLFGCYSAMVLVSWVIFVFPNLHFYSVQSGWGRFFTDTLKCLIWPVLWLMIWMDL
jgi:hypothetical protein